MNKGYLLHLLTIPVLTCSAPTPPFPFPPFPSLCSALPPPLLLFLFQRHYQLKADSSSHVLLPSLYLQPLPALPDIFLIVHLL